MQIFAESPVELPAEMFRVFNFRARLTWDHAQIFVEPRACALPTVTSYLLHIFKFSWFLFLPVREKREILHRAKNSRYTLLEFYKMRKQIKYMKSRNAPTTLLEQYKTASETLKNCLISEYNKYRNITNSIEI